MLDLTGRRYLVTGVLNQDSIAYATACALQDAGAEIVLTGFGRSMRITRASAACLPKPADVLELDVNEPAHFDRLAADLEARWGGLDGVVHAIAAAPRDAHSANFLTTSKDSATSAFHISAYSLHALTVALAPLLSRRGGSVVGLDFDASTAWYGYDWMGVSKAALESLCRYLAMYLGGSGIRVNLVAAGPIETVAGRAISTFDTLADRWSAEAPLGWDRADPAVVAGPVLFLLSELSRCVTGEIIHADGGLHAVTLGRPIGETPCPRPSSE
ncbi:enoyl-ACP reductase FabI [Actinokineospora sp. 24-640]